LDDSIDDTFVSSVREEVDRTTLPRLSIVGFNQLSVLTNRFSMFYGWNPSAIHLANNSMRD
jgi:hypothetical protein